jgi:REP element-mobilizing transposase RayT
MEIDYWQNFEEGFYYHIYNHAAGNENIFNSKKDYHDFLTKHFKYLSFVFETIAYCLMPNHFHFIVKVKSKEVVMQGILEDTSQAIILFRNGKCDLNDLILDQYRRYFSSYALSYNFRNKHRGQLFLKRFKRVSLNEETRLQYQICYVHHNPIHHKFEKDYSSWKYSSYMSIIQSLKDSQITETANLYFDGEADFIGKHNSFQIDYENKLNLD